MTDAGKRVLAIVEQETMRNFVEAALEHEGFEVRPEKSAFGALKTFERDQGFQLIVVDLNLTDIGALEVVLFVRKRWSAEQMPIVLIATDGKEADRDRGMKLGANGYVVKPFRPEELISVARQCMAAAAGK